MQLWLCLPLLGLFISNASQAQDDGRTKRCEVRPGCVYLTTPDRNCPTARYEGGTCPNGLLQGIVKTYPATGNRVVTGEYAAGKPSGLFVASNGDGILDVWRTGQKITSCVVDNSGRITGSSDEALCRSALSALGGVAAMGTTQAPNTASVETQPSPQQNVNAARPNSPRVLDATVLSTNSAARSSVKIRIPSSFVNPTAQKLEEFVPPRSANACIGTEKAGQFTQVASSCSQTVLAVTKANSANTTRWDGYFLATHHFKDPVYLDNQTKHDGPFETTSCFNGDRHCTELWLQTLQHCKRWLPAPNRSKSVSYKGLGAIDSYVLDCAPDSSKRQGEALWEKFNTELFTKWTSFMDANLPGKESSSDDGATQCAVQLYVPMLQIHLDTLYKHQKERGIPHSTCDASVFGIK